MFIKSKFIVAIADSIFSLEELAFIRDATKEAYIDHAPSGRSWPNLH